MTDAVELTRLADVLPERVSWLWEGYLPRGKLVTLDGDPGLGKSTLAVEIGATVTNGGTWPDGTGCAHPGAVLVMSAEDGLADTVRPRFDAAGADVSKVYAVEGVPILHDDGTRTLRPPNLADVAALTEAITATSARLLIVDVVMAYLPSGTDAHKDQDIRRILSALSKLADNSGCTVLLLRHLNKAAGRDPLYRGGGSIGIVGAARAGLLVARDPDDDDRRIVVSVKSNLGRMPDSLIYRLVDSPDHGCARVIWEGTSAHTAATALSERSDDDAHDVDRWLTEFLKSGPVRATEVYSAAHAAGYSADQSKRAKKRLNIAADKAADGRWMWVMPSGADQGSADQGSAPASQNDAPLLPSSSETVREGEIRSREHCARDRSLGLPGVQSPAAMPPTATPKRATADTPAPPRQRQRTRGQQTRGNCPPCTVCGNPVTAGQGDRHLSCATGAAS